MSRVAIIGRHDRREEFKKYRAELEELGFIVTANWLDDPGERDYSFRPDEVHDDPERATTYANARIEEVLDADYVLVFGDNRPDPGARHVLLGIVLGRRTCFFIGPMENEYNALLANAHFAGWADFITKQKEANNATTPRSTEAKQPVSVDGAAGESAVAGG